MEFCWNFGF